MMEKPSYNELLKQVEVLQSKIYGLEHQLEEQREKSSRLKSRFLATVSHEIRTPMNAILGFSNLLIDKNLTLEKKEEYMEHINNNSNNLLNLVDSMIDISLMEINELKIKKEEFNLHKVLQQLYTYFNISKVKMDKDHIAILLNNEFRDKEFKVYSDPFRLKQILTSLFHNALKLTSKGLIEFGYNVDPQKEKLHFFIKDSGKGVLFEKAQSIFNKNEKPESSFGNNEGGVGLGLTLAKGLVNLLGGEIWMETNLFGGTTFHFTVDYRKEKVDKESSAIKLQAILV
ncbi:MAG: sensor histidine kinase [Bacteroidales bacterium]